MLDNDKQQFLQSFKKLRLENNAMMDEMGRLKKVEDSMNKLNHQGIIDQNCNPLPRKQ
jgi:hypothetical protein